MPNFCLQRFFFDMEFNRTVCGWAFQKWEFPLTSNTFTRIQISTSQFQKFCPIAVNRGSAETTSTGGSRKMWGYTNAVTSVLQLELTCECPATDSVRFPSRYSKFTVCQLLSRNLTLSCVSNFCPWTATENSSLSGCTSREIELPAFVWEKSSPPTHVRKLSPVCPWRDTGVNNLTYDEPLKKPSLCWAL